MDTRQILAQLHAERNRIDRAIAAIEAIQSDSKSRASFAGTRRRRGRMSAAGRKRLSELMKKRWASGKMRGRSKAA
jgi:SLT domain-containing protein